MCTTQPVKFMKKIVLLFCLVNVLASCSKKTDGTDLDGNMMARIAELEIHPDYLAEYLAILREESRLSVQREAGVICIFPMQIKESPVSIRLVEIYASKQAYEDHLESAHFKRYKSATLHMVRSLKLIDVQAVDTAAMPLIFQKAKSGTTTLSTGIVKQGAENFRKETQPRGCKLPVRGWCQRVAGISFYPKQTDRLPGVPGRTL